MSFESTLYSYLTGHAGLAALVSDKIYPDEAPQDAAAPYVVFQEVYREKMYSQGGYNTASEWTIQISSYSADRDQVRQVADQVSAAMESWPSANGQIGYCQQENERSTWIEPLGLYVIDQDFVIYYQD